jgi:hypothetical protein
VKPAWMLFHKYTQRILGKEKTNFFPAVFALSDFKIDRGHEAPKLTTIIASNTDASVIIFPHIFYFTV